jgi:hypothetical protein
MAAASYELFDPYPVTGDEIRTVAEESNGSLSDLQELEGDVKSSHKTTVDAVEGDIAPYVGSAADPSTQQNQSVRQTVTFAKGALIMFGNYVDDYNLESGPAYNTPGSRENPRSVSKLNQCYREQLNNSFGLNDEDYEEGGSKENGDYSADWQSRSSAAQSELQTEYGWLGGKLDDDAEEVANLLKGPITEEKVRLMYGAGGLPSNVATIWPNFDFSGISFDELPSDLAAMTDEELADYLLEHPDLDPNIMLNLDSLAPAVVPIMGDKLADKIRDADVAWDTDPEKLQELQELLQTWQDTSLNITAEMYKSLGAEDSLEFLAALGGNFQGDDDGGPARDLASVFRRGLGLADAMWSDEEQTDFGRDLGQALQDNQTNYPPVVGMETALQYLLQDQYYSDNLLNPLGDKLVELDYGPNSWNNTEVSNLEVGDRDMMSSFFSALAHNDDAGKYFFGQDGRVDQYMEREGNDPHYFNNLGNALEAATTENPDQTAADIVADIVHHVGSKENNQEVFAENDLMNPELRDDMASIMTTWIASVHDSMVPGQPFDGPGADGDWDPVTPGKQEFGVEFDQRELAFFLGDLGKDEGAHDALVAAEHTYAATAYDHYMSDPNLTPEQRALQAERVANPTGSVLGALDFGAASQEHQTTADNDQAHNDRVDAAFTVADSLVGLIPTDKVPLAGDAIGFLMGELQDSLQQDTTGQGNYNAGDVYDGGQTSAEAIAQAAYYRNTPDDELPPELQGHPPVAEWTDAQKAAYVDWLQDTGMSPASSNSATGNAGGAYSNGYSDAQHLING